MNVRERKIVQNSARSAIGPVPVELDGQALYRQHVNPMWVKLLDVLGMNVRYIRASGAELYTDDGRTILDCLSGYCVHNVGHNHPSIVAEVMS